MAGKLQQWSVQNMADAVEAVLDGSMGYKKASKVFEVPQTTLERRIKKAREERKSPFEVSQKGMGIQLVFSVEQEKELVNFILLMESRMFGLTLTDVRRLAYELATKNSIKNNFNKETQMAGKDWLYSFLKRNPKIVLRSPEATSLARAMSFNITTVNSFFDLLDDLYNRYNFPPDKIFNVDETGVSTVPNKSSRILGLKGKRQIGGISSAERGNLTTAVVCMSASGNYMPPMFIFPRVRPNLDLLEGSPPGSSCEFHPSGWIQTDLFLKWFDRFVAFSNPTVDSPVLLILDGHATHVKNLRLIQMAREQHVVVLCIPPHCSHRLQPLDVSFMKPLSTYYNETVRIWLREHPGRAVTLRQISQLFGNGYIKAAAMETAINGFRKTGIFPCNRNIFNESSFAASLTTDRAIPNIEINNNKPGCSYEYNQRVSTDDTRESENQMSSSFLKIQPLHIIDIPKGERKVTNRKRGKAAVITESPYKNELEVSQNAKEIKDKKKNSNTETKLTRRKRKLGQKIQCLTPKKRIIIKTSDFKIERFIDENRRDAKRMDQDSSDEQSDTNDSCILCSKPFEEGGWAHCVSCNGGAHEKCTGYGFEEEMDDFKCPLCLSLERENILKS